MSRKFKQMAQFIPAGTIGVSGTGPEENDRAAALSATYDCRLSSALCSPAWIADPSRGGGRAVGD